VPLPKTLAPEDKEEQFFETSKFDNRYQQTTAKSEEMSSENLISDFEI
jgi:hypothetical protein